MSREREAAELTDKARDLGGPREEEPTESDFIGDENAADESDDHPARGFWIYAHPLASKKAAEVLIAIQTIVGQVTSEFQGHVTREEWRSAFQSEMQSLREHDVSQEVAEEERWTTPQTKSFQERTFSSSSVKAQRRFGLSHSEIFRRTLVLQPFTINANVITVRVVLLIAGMFAWFLTGIDVKTFDVKTAFLHASLDAQEKVYVRPPPLLCRWGFTGKGALCRLKKALYGLRSAPRLWGLTHERRCGRCVGHVSRTARIRSETTVALKRACCFLMIKVRQSGAFRAMFSHMSTTWLHVTFQFFTCL